MKRIYALCRPVTAAVTAALLLGACAQWQRAEDARGDTRGDTALPSVQPASSPAQPAPQAAAVAGPTLPRQELTDELLYEFLLAEVAAQRGDAATSAQAYADLAVQTRDPRIARRAWEIAMAAHAPELALEAARVWFAADPTSSEARRRLAVLLLGMGHVDEARPLLEQMLAERELDRGEAFMQLSRLLRGADDEAILRLMRELASAYPNLPEAHLAVARAAHEAGQHALAAQEVQAALKLKPDWEPAVLLQALVLQKSAGGAAARAYLEAYLAEHPDAIDVRLNYGRLLVAERRYADARRQFGAVLQANPLQTDALYAAGVLSLELGDYAVAEGHLERLLGLNYPDRDALLLYLGRIAEAEKRYDEAMQRYAAVGGREHLYEALVRQAGILARQGKLAEARKVLQNMRAREHDAVRRTQLVLAEARLLREAGQDKSAFEVLTRALVKQPDDPDLLYDRAMVAEKLDRMDVLESSLRKLIRLRPDYPHAYNALGYSFAERNVRLAEARELIDKAHALAPKDAFILDSMGWVRYRQGDQAGAIDYLQRAWAVSKDPEIAAHLGEVYWMAGRRDEARAVWAEARRTDPDNEALRKVMQRLER